MRSTMGQEHLNGLEVLNIHKEISVNIYEVIDIFLKTSGRMKSDQWRIYGGEGSRGTGPHQIMKN
jgi:hypothetical protein